MHFQTKQTAFFTLLLSLVIFSACHKEAPQGNLVEGQVALTFDDASVENWYNNLALLDSLNIKATFYISHYHTFGKQQKAWLKEIEKRGHEIPTTLPTTPT